MNFDVGTKYRVISDSYVKQMLQECDLDTFCVWFTCHMGDVKDDIHGIVDMKILLKERFDLEKKK